jgi:hypothetical protein
LLLDHLMISAQDWRAAHAAYERLGFKVTDLRRNAPMGGADGSDGGSQLIMLRGHDPSILNYLELSTAVPGKAAPAVAAILGRGDGPAMLVNFCEQIDLVQSEWQARSIKSYAFEASFPASGTLGGGKFKIVIADPAASLVCVDAVFSADRSGYASSEWLEHENGAIAWSRVYCVAEGDELRALCDFLATIHGKDFVAVPSGWHEFALGQVRVCVMGRDALAERLAIDPLRLRQGAQIAGFSIECADLPRVRKLFDSRGVAYRERFGALVVSPEDACGSVIEFVNGAQS